MYSSKLQLALTVGALFGNYYHHHPHRVNISLGLESMPDAPSIQNDPPGFSFDSNFEPKLDEIVDDMERHASSMPPKTIFNAYEYRGDFVLQNKQTVPHGTGSYEIGESKIVGNFENGNLTGPFKFTSREQDIVVKSVLKGDKMDDLAVAYSKGCKFEMDIAHRSYIFTDQFENKAYVQVMPGNYRLTKFYDKNGKKLYTEYKNSQESGIREIFDEDGSRLTVEMRNGQLEGQSLYKDRYGDSIYKGSFKNGSATKNWSLYTEVASILGICLLTTFWPRSPRRTLSRMRNMLFRSSKSKKLGF